MYILQYISAPIQPNAAETKVNQSKTPKTAPSKTFPPPPPTLVPTPQIMRGAGCILQREVFPPTQSNSPLRTQNTTTTTNTKRSENRLTPRNDKPGTERKRKRHTNKNTPRRTEKTRDDRELAEEESPVGWFKREKLTNAIYTKEPTTTTTLSQRRTSGERRRRWRQQQTVCTTERVSVGSDTDEHRTRSWRFNQQKTCCATTRHFGECAARLSQALRERERESLLWYRKHNLAKGSVAVIAADSRPRQTILSRVDKERVDVFVRQQSTLCLVLVDVRESGPCVCAVLIVGVYSLSL